MSNSVSSAKVSGTPSQEGFFLALDKADIRGMSMDSRGSLVISKTNGETLTIENFAQLAARGAQLSLQDGALDAGQILAGLEQGGEILSIGRPAAGETVTYELESGQRYLVGFDMTQDGNAQQSGGALIITFSDGGQVVLANFDEAMADGAPPEMIFTQGTYVSLLEFGATLDADSLLTAQQLAGIEPGAGNTGSAGYGFQSETDDASFGTVAEAQGALGDTTFAAGGGASFRTASLTLLPEPPAAASVFAGDQYVAEDGVLNFNMSVNSNGGATVQTTIVISGLPSGWAVTPNGGTYDATAGTWTITLPAGTKNFTGGPTLAPPFDSDVDANDIQITVTNKDTDTGLTSTASQTVDIQVDAVGDNPHLYATSSAVDEDTPAALSIYTSVTDRDGSEQITGIYVHNVPAGFSLSQGVDQGGGTWLLTTGQLAGLAVIPPSGFSGSVALRVESVSDETRPSGVDFDPTNNLGQSFYDLSVEWNPVADTPTIQIGGPGGSGLSVLEDGTASIPVKVTLGDTDGSEFLTVKVSGIPAAWAFNNPGWTDLGGGSWQRSFAPGVNFDGTLSLKPPANSDVDLANFKITATATETATGASATANGTATIIVDAVADTPTLAASNASGNEDTAVAVTFNAALTDTDGSEIISGYKVSGVPAGFSFNAGTNAGGGVWTFTPAQLAGLKIAAPANFYGTINLTATVLSTEDPSTDGETTAANNNAQASDAFSITWNPVADAPTLTVNGGNANVTVLEDGTVNVPIAGQLAADATGSEVLKVTITGIPAAWTFTAPIGTYNAATGTWTATLPAGADLNTVVTFKPPANSDVDLSGLNISLSATEPSTGTTATASQTFNVIVDAVSDGVNVNAVNVSGQEDTAVAVNIAATLRDTDGSESVTGYKISGVPAGFSFNAGTNLGGGVWSFTPAQLAGLKIAAPANYYGTVNLTATALSKETPSDGETTAANNNSESSDAFTVTWTPVADAPTLTVNGGNPTATVLEDGTVNVPIAGQLAADATGSEVLKVTITGIPAAWTFTAPIGTYNAATGTWTATLPAGTDLNTVVTFKPPANSDVDLSGLNISLSATEPSTGTTATASQTFKIIVDAVADDVNINAINMAGNEDTAVAVTINAALTDTDGSEIISGYRISGVPAGFSFNAGTNLGGGVWSFTPAQIAGLKITAPANYYGTVNLTATVLSTEDPSTDGETTAANNNAQASDAFSVTWNPVADAPTLTVNGGSPTATVLEDGTVNVPISGTFAADATGNEVLKVTITGIPAAWTFTAPVGTYNPATGTWTATLPAGADLNTVVTFKPPANSDVDLSGLNISLTATNPSTGTAASDTQTFKIIVDAVADAPALTVANATGEEGNTIALNIGAAVTDTDGSESIQAVKISNLPAGATLTAGTQISPGVWQLTKAQLAGLGVNVPDGSAGTFAVRVEAISVESATSGGEPNTGNNQASTVKTFTLTVQNDDTPVLVGGPEQITVDESNIVPGGLTASDRVTADFGSDAPGTYAANGTSNLGGLKSNGVAVAVTQSGNTYIGKAGTATVFTLQINADGTYTYKQFAAMDHANPANANDSLSFKLGFKAVDSDGDVLNDFITVNVLDDGPFAPDYLAPVDETSLRSGPIVVNRTLPNLSFGHDGPGDVRPTGTFQAVIAADGTLTNLRSGGQLVTVTATANGYVGKVGTETIFLLAVDPATGVHTYKQFAGIDHPNTGAPNESMWLKFQMKATDDEGDSRNFFIGVDVRDDAPVARNDVNSYDTTGTPSTTGNVITGAGSDAGLADVVGGDGASVTRVSIGGTGYNVAATGITTINGAHGVLKISANGAYTYTKTGTGNDVFNYILKDGDGDTSAASLTINGTPALDISELKVNGGDNNAWVMEDGVVNVPFTVKYVGGDGDETVTIKLTGVAPGWMVSGAGWTHLGGGTWQLVESQRNYNGNISFRPPANSDVDLTGLTITASVRDPDNGVTKSASDVFHVRTDAVADAANLSVSAGLSRSWDRDDHRKITFNFPVAANQTTDVDGSQIITKMVFRLNNGFGAWGGNPDTAGWYLNKGIEVAPGVWEIPVGSNNAAAALHGLQLIIPKHGSWWSGLAFHRWDTSYITVEAHVQELWLSGQELTGANNTAVTIRNVPVSIYITPLVLDLGERGIDFVSQAEGVMFDMNNNGTLDKTSWVGANDGILALDLNGDGLVNNQSELFGDTETASNGFANLAQHDVNGDGIINASDSVFENILVWQDANQDGISQDGELRSLSDYGIAGIRLGATETGYEAADGWVSHESTFLYVDGTEGQIVDAWFNIREGETIGQGAVLNGSEQADYIFGTADNDVIAGLAGDDTLYGDAGADVFLFAAVDGSVDTITDFNLGEGDKLDLSQLLGDIGFDPLQNSINDFVYARDEGGKTIVSVDIAGSGDAANGVTIAILDNVTGVTVEELLARATVGA